MSLRLNSLLITPALTVLTVISAIAIYQLAIGDSLLAWSGVLLTSLPLPALLGWAFISQRLARTSNRLPVLLGAGAIGLALAMVSTDLRQPASPPVLAAAAFIIFLWYDFVYSAFGRQPNRRLQVGERLPDFPLQQPDGTEISSTDFAGQPALFLFYRGNWCPLCMAQVKEIAGQYRQLADRGVQVMLVSPQPAGNSAKLAAKYDVPFQFLVDPNNRAAKILNIEAIAGLPGGLELFGYDSDTVLPTVIATDAEGRIIFVDQTDNYRVRPEPETFLAIFDAATKPA